MFKKEYFVHLVQRNVKKGASFEEWLGVVRARNALSAMQMAEEAWAVKDGYYLKEIRKI